MKKLDFCLTCQKNVSSRQLRVIGYIAFMFIFSVFLLYFVKGNLSTNLHHNVLMCVKFEKNQFIKQWNYEEGAYMRIIFRIESFLLITKQVCKYSLLRTSSATTLYIYRIKTTNPAKHSWTLFAACKNWLILNLDGQKKCLWFFWINVFFL